MSATTIQRHQEPDRTIEWTVDTTDTRSRQRQVSGVGMLVLGAVIAASLRADLFGRTDGGRLVDPSSLRSASVVLAVGFLAYAVEQDRRLRAIEVRQAAHADAPGSTKGGTGPDRRRPRVDDRVDDRVAARLHASLLVTDVVRALLAEARQALECDGVELRLIGIDGRSRSAGLLGARTTAARQVEVADGRVRLGELVVYGRLGQGDELLCDLAAHGAAALVNARRFEDALNALGELRDTRSRRASTISLAC